MPGKTHYVAAFDAAWQRELKTAEKLPLSPQAMDKLRQHARRDLYDTIDQLMDDPPALKVNGKPRKWPDDEPVWRAWAQWYPSWVKAEAQRVIPDIVRNCALDREGRERERARDGMAALSRVALAEKIVSHLGTKAKTQDELEAGMYPPKAHKARKHCRNVVALLDGLGVVGWQKCRDGEKRLALWRGLWPEDRDALAAGL